MNDFTKEELESILNWADVYTEFGLCWSYAVHEPTIKKIQAMINEYCDHESDGLNYLSDPAQLKCSKCSNFYCALSNHPISMPFMYLHETLSSEDRELILKVPYEEG